MFQSSNHLISAKFSQSFYFFLENLVFLQEKVIIFLEICAAFPARVHKLVRELNGEYRHWLQFSSLPNPYPYRLLFYLIPIHWFGPIT